ncbi:pre-rRNA-processing protein esf1 [Geranomyces michiganensis]|nr:pre-rRNA-processing protein esf1 [Geranomyces michiganensis]
MPPKKSASAQKSVAVAAAAGKKKSKAGGLPPQRAPVSSVPITTDPRFSRVHSDPRFIKAKKDANKVKIDSRFAGMLKSDEFGTGSSGPRIDKYGRAAKKATQSGLERFYKLDEADSDEEDNVDGGDKERDDEAEDEEDDHALEAGSDSVGADTDSEEFEYDGEFERESDDEDDAAVGPLRGYDLARGGGLLESDSEEEDDDAAAPSDEETARDSKAIDVGPYAEEDVPTGEETSRIAVVNLDWDHVKARDLFKIFDGFKPSSGTVKSVKIYPSEFGKERLEREAREGPPKELFEDSDADDEENDLNKPLIRAEDGTEDYDNVKLRKYQLERLKYYYAVVECDSTATARAIYKECDGTEYETSANFFDLRYVPTGMTFDDPPSDVATDLPSAYVPKDFVTNALQHSKVKLTWDDDDDDRVRVTKRHFTKNDLAEMDFKAYLASSSDESDDPDRDSAAAIRAKFMGILGEVGEATDVYGNKDAEGDMEITFAPGLSEKAAKLLEKKKEDAALKDETVFDAYLRKRKEKRKAKKNARKAGDGSGGDSGEDGSNLDDHSESSEDDRAIDMDDPFFAEEFGDDFKPPKNAAKAKSKPTKSGKNKKQTEEERRAEQNARAELELLIAPTPGTSSAAAGEGRHFDAKQIIKEEKAARNKKGRKAKKNKETREGGVQDGFEINTSDPRFEALLENHNFAIDPTNPQFKKTQAMGKLLDERRKRRANVDHALEAASAPVAAPTAEAGRAEMSSLVDSVKRKSAMAMGGDGRGKRQKKGGKSV